MGTYPGLIELVDRVLFAGRRHGDVTEDYPYLQENLNRLEDDFRSYKQAPLMVEPYSLTKIEQEC